MYIFAITNSFFAVVVVVVVIFIKIIREKSYYNGNGSLSIYRREYKGKSIISFRRVYFSPSNALYVHWEKCPVNICIVFVNNYVYKTIFHGTLICFPPLNSPLLKYNNIAGTFYFPRRKKKPPSP